jgi:hypothetical protein
MHYSSPSLFSSPSCTHFSPKRRSPTSQFSPMKQTPQRWSVVAGGCSARLRLEAAADCKRSSGQQVDRRRQQGVAAYSSAVGPCSSMPSARVQLLLPLYQHLCSSSAFAAKIHIATDLHVLLRRAPTWDPAHRPRCSRGPPRRWAD